MDRALGRLLPHVSSRCCTSCHALKQSVRRHGTEALICNCRARAVFTCSDGDSCEGVVQLQAPCWTQVLSMGGTNGFSEHTGIGFRHRCVAGPNLDGHRRRAGNRR